MFRNPSGTIKFFAKILFFVEVFFLIIYTLISIISVVSSGSLMPTYFDITEANTTAAVYVITCLIYIIVLLIGIVLSWFSALLVYGFGELIEKATITAKNTEELLYMAENTNSRT